MAAPTWELEAGRSEVQIQSRLNDIVSHHHTSEKSKGLPLGVKTSQGNGTSHTG